MDHITITDLRKEIERKREEPFTDEQFEVLLSGFGAYCKRTGLFTQIYVGQAIRRGWFGAQMAHFFKRYAFE